MAIIIEYNSLCLLVDLKKVSSKVNANILLYNTINVPITTRLNTTLRINSSLVIPKILPYRYPSISIFVPCV